MFEFPIRVYIEDTDIGGIVYYVNYLKFMERARTEFLRSHKIEQQDLQQQGFLFVVKSANCDYLASAKLDDQLTISVEVAKCSAASVTFLQTIHTHQLLTRAEVVVVCVNAETMKPCRFPPQIRQIFSNS